SLFDLGIQFLKGEEVPKDLDEAVRWLSLAAEQNHTDAQITLATMYYEGEGVEKDLRLAIKLFRAAAPECLEAQVVLGEVHSDPASPVYDLPTALEYYRLAAEADHTQSQYQCFCLLKDKNEEDQR